MPLIIQSFSSNKISYQKNNVVLANIAYAFFVSTHQQKSFADDMLFVMMSEKKIIVVVVCMYYVAGCCYILHDIRLLLLDFSPLNLTDISCHV